MPGLKLLKRDASHTTDLKIVRNGPEEVKFFASDQKDFLFNEWKDNASSPTTNGTTPRTAHGKCLERAERALLQIQTVDVIIVVFVLGAWLAAIIVFLRKWARLRLVPQPIIGYHCKPKNLEAVKVVQRPRDSIIYRGVSRCNSRQKRFERMRTVPNIKFFPENGQEAGSEVVALRFDGQLGKKSSEIDVTGFNMGSDDRNFQIKERLEVDGCRHGIHMKLDYNNLIAAKTLLSDRENFMAECKESDMPMNNVRLELCATSSSVTKLPDIMESEQSIDLPDPELNVNLNVLDDVLEDSPKI